MKLKLVEYPYGREIGFKQDIVWFIQGTDNSKTWYNYVWCNDKCSPSIIEETNKPYSRTYPPISAYLSVKSANEAFDKIVDYYRKQLTEKPINILKEVEI